jgi:hypothetical protein
MRSADPNEVEQKAGLSRNGMKRLTDKRVSPTPPGLVRTPHRKAPRPFVISGPASPMMPSLNQVVGFLTDWEGFRRLAA